MLKPGQVVKEFVSKKDNKVVLRTPKMEDLEAITDMINSIIREDDFILLNEEVKIEDEKKWLEGKIEGNQSGKHLYLVTEVDEKVVGSSDVCPGVGRTSHAGGLGIAIRDGYREEGIGTELMKTVLEYAKENLELKLIKLEVYSTNKRAQNLYQKLGFIEFGTLPNEIQMKDSVCDSIYMYKEL